MRIGAETASLVNHVYSRMTSEPPYVGMPATLLSWTDRSPATVVDVNMKGRCIVVQEDDYQRIDNNGLSESQEYEYARNPKASVYIFRKNKKGEWVQHRFNPKTNRLVQSRGYGLMLGKREKYHDFSF
jgi:hypothetical protein